MSIFQATNQNNPCPVCEKTNGNCRILPDEGILCMTLADKFIGQDHPTYQYVKQTKCGRWGIFYQTILRTKLVRNGTIGTKLLEIRV